MEGTMVPIIRENLKSKSTEELLKIWNDNNRNVWSNDAFLAIKQILAERNVEMPEQGQVKGKEPENDTINAGNDNTPAHELGGDKELNDYILLVPGISRTMLNILCFVGLWIFGWLLLVVFDMLGKNKTGWYYMISYILCNALARFAEVPAAIILGILIYGIGWIHANRVLSNYKASARLRLEALDRLPEEEQTINTVLEKGLLQGKVLTDKSGATRTFEYAFEKPGGDSRLLNLAGTRLFKSKHYPAAKMYFTRALQNVTDSTLRDQITKNLHNVEKKLLPKN